MKRLIVLFMISVFALSFFASCAKKNDDGDNRKREMTNFYVLVNFSDDGFSVEQKETVFDVFSGEGNSLEKYVDFVSENTVSLSTEFIGEVKVDYSEDYFMPAYVEESGKYSLVNANGYDNRYFTADGQPDVNGQKQSVESFLRGEELVAAVCERLTESSLERSLAENQAIDCLTLVFNLPSVPSTESLLWAKKGEFFYGEVSAISSVYEIDERYSSLDIKEQKVLNKSINDYIFLPYAMMKHGDTPSSVTICHEFMHVLGAADMYSYSGGEKELVGELDIMSSGYTGVTPKMPLSYTRYKTGFLKEGENILPVTGEGEYTLSSTESGKSKVKAYKLVLPDFETERECFYIEYRQKTSYGSELSSGFEDGAFIIYRVNEDNGYLLSDGKTYGGHYYGNALAEEVYAFRFMQKTSSGFAENEKVSLSGISHAAISDQTGYSSYGNKVGKTNAVTYSNGKNTGVTVEFVRREDESSATFSISFDYKAKTLAEVDKCNISRSVDGGLELFFDTPLTNGTVYVLETDKRIAEVDAEALVDGKYGNVSVVPSAFMRAKLVGDKKYVYVALNDGDNIRLVRTFALGGESVDYAPVVAIISVAAAVIVILTVFVVVKAALKKRK